MIECEIYYFHQRVIHCLPQIIVKTITKIVRNPFIERHFMSTKYSNIPYGSM